MRYVRVEPVSEPHPGYELDADAYLAVLPQIEAELPEGARRFALTVGRAMELALLIRHAQWSIDHENDTRTAAAAHRFAHSVIDLVVDDFSK